MTKRLFIFAAYDTRNHIRGTNDAAVVDESTVKYVNALFELGDVAFYMDNDISDAELKKLKPYTVYTGASTHGEYDFGSYKRAYIWARDHLNLSDYDWVYLVNDSMYAPLHEIGPVLKELESRDTDASGMVFNDHHDHPHIQSWFIGLGSDVFLSKQFDKFITSVKRHDKDKGLVTKLYEQGVTRMLIENKWSFSCTYTVTGHAIYNQVKRLFKRGLPCMKKVAFARHGGALGRQVLYILNHIDPSMRAAILSEAYRVYGQETVDRNLTNNPFKIIWRNVKYALYKIASKGL